MKTARVIIELQFEDGSDESVLKQAAKWAHDQYFYDFDSKYYPDIESMGYFIDRDIRQTNDKNTVQ